MDIYLIFKFLHVASASAIVWLGAGFGLVVLGIFADSRKDNEGFGRVIEYVIFLSPRLFIPVSLAAFVFGVIAATVQWGFTDLWVILGVVGFAATFLTGLLLLKPASEHLAALIAKEGYSDNVVTHGRTLLDQAKFDYVVLFAVVFDMVVKPTSSDWPALLLIVIAIIRGSGLLPRPPDDEGRCRAGVSGRPKPRRGE
jgi:hypothetical protein